MPQIDKEEVKRVFGAVNALYLNKRLRPPTSKILLDNQKEAQRELRDYFAKTGLSSSKLDKLATNRDTERRKLMDAHIASTLPDSAANGATFRQGMAYQQQALQILANPFESTYLLLEEPFLIWQYPNTDQSTWVDTNYESLNSFVKFLVNTNGGGTAYQFVFYFIWLNQSNYAAVFNVDTSIVLNGLCQVFATHGAVTYVHNSASLAANLTLMRWGGWGIDPTTGKSNDQTVFPYTQQSQYTDIAYIDQNGGDWFHPPHGNDTQAFTYQPFSMSCDLIPVPAGASMLFEVALLVEYAFEHGGGGVNDLVKLDFADNQFDRRAICPSLRLELLTPASRDASMAASA
jgi:hypothetical protein